MKRLKVFVFETSESGHKMTKLAAFPAADAQAAVALFPEEKYQTITGIGGSFTKASATLFKQLSAASQAKILEAYFGDSGARYPLTRTHINSCDFSPYCYTYAPVAGDVQLEHFSIADDLDDLVPMIKAAQKVSTEGFRIIASPWTAPPWMKDNNDWRGGKLLPQYYGVRALFFSKYLDAYRSQGIDIWAITPENEPLDNGNNWESMHFTPYEMADFVQNHLHPLLRQKGHTVKILGFDQNRDEELKKWTDVLFGDETVARRFDGMAVHWYASTFDWFPEALQYVHQKAPDKHLIQTEACVDAQAPRWQDDAWYWAEEATDWGWHWAPEPQKHLHPKYVPVFRYARDIIGCLNNWVDGWIDWNMILDRQGGPNWAQNWCTAPVIVDPARDEVYFTPLYYTMCHFSRFIRPGAVRIGFENSDRGLLMTAAENPDGSIAAVLFNPTASDKGGKISLRSTSIAFAIGPKAVQTLVIGPDTEGLR